MEDQFEYSCGSHGNCHEFNQWGQPVRYLLPRLVGRTRSLLPRIKKSKNKQSKENKLIVNTAPKI
jgi:hypothetical protein